MGLANDRLLVRSLFHWFDQQKLSVRTAIIGAIAVVGVPVVTYFTNRAIDQRRSVNEALHLKKVELYGDIFRFYMLVFGGDVPGRPKPTSDQVAQFITDTKPRLLAYSSNRVIRAWGSVWGEGGLGDDEIENALALERLMKAFRQDLGHGSRTLRDFDIGRLFINDIEATLAAKKEAKKPPGQRERTDPTNSHLGVSLTLNGRRLKSVRGSAKCT